MNHASAPFPSLSLFVCSVCVLNVYACGRVWVDIWVCVCVWGGWVELCCRTAGYPMRAGLFSCVLCVYFLVYIVTSFTLLPLSKKLREVIQAYRYIHIYFLEPEKKMLNQKWSNKCVLFSCFWGEHQWGTGESSCVTFRQSSGMLNYTLTVNPCLAWSWWVSLCPCLFPEKDMGHKIVEETNMNTWSTLIGF